MKGLEPSTFCMASASARWLKRACLKGSPTRAPDIAGRNVTQAGETAATGALRSTQRADRGVPRLASLVFAARPWRARGLVANRDGAVLQAGDHLPGNHAS